MFLGRYNYASIVTYTGVAFAVTAMYHAIYANNIYVSFMFLILSGICDLFDGFVARKIDRDDEEKQFGIQIDSLADTVNFVVLPVIIGLSLEKPNILVILIYVLYAVCGITRLAYFNVSVQSVSEETRPKHFTGMPVTFSALLFPLVYLIGDKLNVELYNIFTLILGVLFVLKIQVPKPRGIAYVLLVVLAVVMIVYFAMEGIN